MRSVSKIERITSEHQTGCINKNIVSLVFLADVLE